MAISSDKRNLAKSPLGTFERIRWSVAIWGVLLILGGALHSPITKAASVDVAMFMWLLLSIIGLAVMYWIAPETLSSGMLYVWGGALLLGFIGQGLLLHAFNEQEYSSTLWHVFLALGYLALAIYMDKRWWWLVGWEAVWAVLMLWFALDNEDRLTPIMIGQFTPANNLSWLFGFTSGLALLLASLPFWKESYSR